MKNISEILKRTRIQSGITIEQVELATKIKKTYIEFLEKGEFEKLPSISATKGFIKIYAKYLGLNAEEALVIFRRENKNEEHHMMIKKRKSTKFNSIKNKRISLYILFISIVVILAIVYAVHEYISFKTPPTITIYSPIRVNTVSYKSSILFSGKITLGDSLYIDGDKINSINLNGDFSQQVGLQEGVNNIEIKIIDPLGGENIKYYQINYINKLVNKKDAYNTFYINIKDVIKPVFINAVVENKTEYNKILKGEIQIKGIYNIVLSVGEIQDTEIFYKGKNVTPTGTGFSVIIIKYNKGTIQITKN